MSIRNTIITLVVAFIALFAVVYFNPLSLVSESSSLQIINENLVVTDTLEEVNFCGNIFQTKGIYLGDVNVMARIAEIATANIKSKEFPQYKGTSEICNKITPSGSENNMLDIETGYGPIEGGAKYYFIYMNAKRDVSFMINPVTKKIYESAVGPEFPDPGNFGIFVPIGYLKSEDFQEVVMCGNTYITRKVAIGGVDLAQRVGELLSKNSFTKKKVVETFCNKLPKEEVGNIPSFEVEAAIFYGYYRVYIEGNDFTIDSVTGDVIFNPFSAKPLFFGKLR